MCYHAHPLFTKLIQNVNLEKSEHFAFLNTSAIQGLVFKRDLFAKQILYDVWILETLVKSIQTFDSMSSNSNDVFVTQQKINLSSQNVKIRFAVALIHDLLNLKTLNENMLQKILSFSLFLTNKDFVSSLFIFMEIIQK